MPSEILRRVKVPLAEFSKFGSEYLTRTQYLYNIRTEDNKIRAFYPNESQMRLHKLAESERQRTYVESNGVSKRFYCIILKPRQVGFTTYTATYISDMMMNLEQCRAMALSHNEKDQDLIWQKYERIFTYMPDVLEIVDPSGRVINEVRFKPTLDRFSDSNIKFGNFTEAELYVRHAGSKDNVGKGDTVNAVHLSEAANYAEYDTVKASLSQQIPLDAPEVFFMVESTANGMTGIGEGFYNEWKRAEASWAAYKAGKTKNFSGFVPFFVPWYEVSKYQMPLINGDMYSIDNVDFYPVSKQKFIENEGMLREEFKVTEEQLNWYRWNLVQRCNSKILDAYRYYPTFPEEAFQGSSQSYFNSGILVPMRANYNPEIFEKQTGYIDDDLTFKTEFGGPLLIRTMPKDDYYGRYYIGMDISTGKEDGDYTVMAVYDKIDDTFVAIWRGLLREDLAAQELVKLASFYNYAKVIPEANMTTVVNIIRPEGFFPYEGEIYVRNYTASGEPQYGYHTGSGNVQTPGSRTSLLSQYLAWLEPQGEDFRYDRILGLDAINEHISFVRKIKGGKTRFEADEKSHDDIVIAKALAIHYAMNDEDAIVDYARKKSQQKDLVSVYKPKSMVKKIPGLSLNKLGKT